MKRLTLILILLLTGCSSGPDEDEFMKFSSEFYVQMFQDGEQSQEVKEMYKEFTQFKGVENEELYTNLEKMYEALGNGEAATPYQMEVMKIINDQES